MKWTEIPEIRTNQQMNAIQTLGIIWNQPETNDKKFLGLSLTTTNYLKNRPIIHHAKTENTLQNTQPNCTGSQISKEKEKTNRN